MPKDKPRFSGDIKDLEKPRFSGTLDTKLPKDTTRFSGEVPQFSPTTPKGREQERFSGEPEMLEAPTGTVWEQVKNFTPAMVRGALEPLPQTLKAGSEFLPSAMSILHPGAYSESKDEVDNPKPVEERDLYQAGNYLQGIVDSLPDVSNTEGALSTQVARGLGQVGSQIGSSFVPVVGPALSIALATGPQVHEEAQLARDLDATPEQVQKVAEANIPIGFTDFVATMLLKGKGNTFKKWLQGGAKIIQKAGESGLIKYIPKIALSVGKGVGIEGTQESLQRYLSNYAAREIYDDSRTLDSGVGREGLVGGIVGGITRGGGHISSSIVEASMRREAAKMRKSVQESSDEELQGAFSQEEFTKANIEFEPGVDVDALGMFTDIGLTKIRENADALNNLEDSRLNTLTNNFTDLVYKAMKIKDPGIRESVKDIVFEMNRAEMFQQHYLSKMRNKINDWEARVPYAQRKDFRKVLLEYVQGNTISRVDMNNKYGEEIVEVAGEIRSFLNNTRVDIQEQIKMNILANTNLTEVESEALSEIQDRVFNLGEDVDVEKVIEQMVLKHGIEEGQVENFHKLANSLVEASRFGMEKYLPNIELGDFIIVNRNTGQRIGFSPTRRKAQRRIDEGEFQETTDGRKNAYVVPANEFQNSNRVNPMRARKEILTGERDIFTALNAYSQFVSNFTIKQPHLRTANLMIGEMGERISSDAATTLRDTIENVKRGHHSKVDQVFDRWVHNKWGFRKGSYSRTLGGIRKWTGRAKFARIGAPLNNAITGAINLLSKYDKVQLTETLAFLRTKKGKDFIKENEAYLGIDLATDIGMNLQEGDTKGKRTLGKKAQHYVDPLTFFRLPEPMIRKVAFATAYRLSLKSGVSHETALRDATMANAMTAFTYNIANMPKFLQSVEAKTVFQFKSYLGKQAEFFVMLPPAKKIKYLSLMLAAGGPRVFIKFAKALPLIGLVNWWGSLDDAERESEELLGDFAYGLPGLFGIDVSTGIALDIPQDIPGVIGPSISLIVKLYNDFRGDPTWEQLGREVGGDFLRYFAIIANSWDVMINTDENGAVHDWKTGKYKYNLNENWMTPTVLNQIGVALGVSNIQKARNYTAEQWFRNNRQKQVQFGRTLLRRVEWSLKNNESISLDDTAQLMALNIDPSTLAYSWNLRKQLTNRQQHQLKLEGLRSIKDWETILPLVITTGNVLE